MAVRATPHARPGRVGVVLHLLVAALLFALPESASAQRGRVVCERCHADREFLVGRSPTPAQDALLFVTDSMLSASRHDSLSCNSCHLRFDDAFPHQPTSETVACASCHETQGVEWAASIHASNVAAADGVAAADAPTCVRCHSAHRVLGREQRASPIHPLNEAALCSECHDDREIIETYFLDPADSVARSAVERYHQTVHGLALDASGLIVSATCSSCHGAHRTLPRDSTGSTVSRDSIPVTCGACHVGVVEDYATSAHGVALAEGREFEGHPAPVCTDCHSSHDIVPPEEVWQASVVEECGICHQRLYETYFHTYHGKVTRLGSELTAKCSDCHTPHANLPADDPASSVHVTNIVATCAQCHEESSARFAQYMPHADPHDRERYPLIYWTWLAMVSLLSGVFLFFGLHSVLWMVRSLVEAGGRKRASAARTRPVPTDTAEPSSGAREEETP